MTTLATIVRPAEPLNRLPLMAAPDASVTLLDVTVTDERAPHVPRHGLRVQIDRGEILIDDGGYSARIEYVDLSLLIEALTQAADLVGDAR